MKRIIGVAVTVVFAIAWAVLTVIPWHGLNSVQQLIAYRGGILDIKPWAAESNKQVAGPVRGVDLLIDSLGIPHIFARDDNGAAYALGYMHARDRYFQMELMAYTVMGRLAEVIGPEGIYSDENWRRFGLEEKARLVLDSLTKVQPAVAAYLRSYARGVNDYIAGEDKAHRDPMFLIWNEAPRQWEASYSFLIQWYMSFDLTFYDDYLDRQELLERLPSRVRMILYPGQANGQPLIVPDQALLPMPVQEEAADSGVRLLQGRISHYRRLPQNPDLGSNNWVVGGGRTLTGHSFLCNDLHLFLSSPNILYELELRSSAIHVYGFSLPGVPVVVTGHNERVAWGITNGGWDVTEQYLLKVDPHHPDRYWLNGRWEQMVTRQFAIQVKDEPVHYQTVQYSVFGPVVRKDSLLIGLRWYPSDWTSGVSSFWGLMHAGDWTDFREALRQYDYPSQNFVYGDIHGNIGVISAGKMPRKLPGYAGGLLDGTVFSPWKYISYDSLPQSYNPSREYLFSANQQPERGRDYYGCRWFSDLYRPARIDELLRRPGKLGWGDMREMQGDVMDLSVKDVQTLLVKYTDTSSLKGGWKDMMRWDGRLTANQREAAFYSSFRNAGWHCSKDLAAMLGVKAEPSFDQLIHFLLGADTLTYRGGLLTSRDCFYRLMRMTDSLYAADTGGGKVYSPYSFTIPQMTFLPGLDRLVDGVGGSDNTISVNYQAHPVIRTLIELDGDHIRSWMANATGQTGRLNDAGYWQQLPAWERNELHPTQFVSDPRYLQHITEHISFTENHP